MIIYVKLAIVNHIWLDQRFHTSHQAGINLGDPFRDAAQLLGSRLCGAWSGILEVKSSDASAIPDQIAHGVVDLVHVMRSPKLKHGHYLIRGIWYHM